METAEREVPAPTRDRILDACFEAIAERCLSGVTVEEVAERAAVSRQTVYRYFPCKDDLLTALVLREDERILEQVEAAATDADGPRDAIRRAAACVLRSAREHPLLDRLLRDEPEGILPYLTTRSVPVMTRATAVCAALLARHAPAAAPETLTSTAESAVRLVMSHVIAPNGRDPADLAVEIAATLAPALEDA